MGFRFSSGRVSLVKSNRERLERVMEEELARIEAEEQEALWAMAAAEIEEDPYGWEEAWAAASALDAGKALKG